MAITEVVRLEIQTQQAKQNMDSLTATINEQKLITIELERELKRLEQALRETPKNALAAQRDLNQQINHVKDSISDQRLSLKELQVQQSQTRDIEKYTNKQAELNTTFKASSLRITDLDAVTGGYGARIKRTAIIFQAVQKAALGFVGSLNAIKVALISTGIGALVVALGAIIAYWDEIKTAVTGVSEEMEEQVKIAKELTEAAQDQLDEIKRIENTLRLQGKTEEQILQLKLEAIRQVIAKRIQEREAARELEQSQLEAEKRNKKLLENAVLFVSIPLSLVLKTIDIVNKAIGNTTDHLGDFQDMVSNWIFDPEQTEKDIAETEKQFDEGIQELQNQADGLTIRLNEINKKRTDDAVTEEQRRLDEIRKLREQELEMQRSLQDQVDALTNEYFEKFLTDQEREQNAVQEKYWNLIEQAQQYGIDTTELEEARLYELEEIQKKYDAERLEAEKQKADAIIAMDELVKQQRLAAGKQAVQDFITAVGEQSTIGKAAAVALATIETYQSAVSSYNSLSGIPIIGPALGAVAAGAAVAAGLANVKKIISVKTPGKGGGGGSGSGGGSASTPRPPSFNMIGDRGGVQDVNSGIDGQNQQPPRAYVVGGDVTTQQELDRNAVNASGF